MAYALRGRSVVLLDLKRRSAADGAARSAEVSQQIRNEMGRLVDLGLLSAEREEGVGELWQKIHEDVGRHYVGHSISGIPQSLFLNEKVDPPNFKALSIRTSSATSNMVKSSGGTPVDLPGGEIYTP